MGKEHLFHHRWLFFLLLFLVLLLAFFASGWHDPNYAPFQKSGIEALSRTAYRFTQPEPPKDPIGNIMFGDECGKRGESNDLLDCQAKEGFGYCMRGYRCRQTGLRLGNKCVCG